MRNKDKTGKKSGPSKGQIKGKILSIISNAPGKEFNYKQLAKRLNTSDPAHKKVISDILKELVREGSVKETGHGRYRAKDSREYVTGTVDLTRMGYGFIESEDRDVDVFVSAKNLHTALHGDKVKVVLFTNKKRSRPEGEVVEIIERWRNTFVGIVEVMPNFAFLIPDNKNMPFDLFIPSGKLNGARQGEKAVAKIVDWSPESKNPVAEIVEVLGEPGLHETEIHAILAEYELPYAFTEEVEADAEKISPDVTKEEIAGRRDFRQIPTLTIDPADARDFDDALSLRKLDNGNWEAGVHIADVTYFVKQGSLTEEEAKQRATSVYLVDRVVPMLPERLSNNICSLNPSEDKLTYSAVFEMNDKGDVINEWFGRTVINSDKRFSYEEAQYVIDTGEGDMKEEVLRLHELAQMLRTKRYAAGAFSFEKVEVKFDLDDEGRPVGIKFREMGTANQLVEEFMILANRRVAEYVGRKLHGSTFVYRVHDKPDPEKISDFSQFIGRFGYKLEDNDRTSLPKAMNRLLNSLTGKKEQNIIETLALRSMAKAIYSVDNIGHYGLALKYYTHFTSPIRRYPDMMVHRLLSLYLSGDKPGDRGKYEKLCEHSSRMERLATEAERASVKYKQVEYMSDKTGRQYEGIISGVTEWGIYVEIIENQCEGMVNVRDLDDDYYEYDEDNYCLRGRSEGKVYMLGDKITIEVVNADLKKKQLDYKLV
ncbi:MAG TPA: ribonuclease R [Bacteroidales bacterium]|nr:ribonuclease R [Bacteroidales bacterium]